MIHLSFGVSERSTPSSFLFSLLFVFTRAFHWGIAINRYGILLHCFPVLSFLWVLVLWSECSFGGERGRPSYALLSSGFVWMLLSLCTLISIVSGLRDSFPFSSFSGSFLQRNRRKKWMCNCSGNCRNPEHTYSWCEQTQPLEWPSRGCFGMKQAHTKNVN